MYEVGAILQFDQDGIRYTLFVPWFHDPMKGMVYALECDECGRLGRKAFTAQEAIDHGINAGWELVRRRVTAHGRAIVNGKEVDRVYCPRCSEARHVG